MKLIVAFHNFVKVPKIITYTKFQHQCLTCTWICNPKIYLYTPLTEDLQYYIKLTNFKIVNWGQFINKVEGMR